VITNPADATGGEHALVHFTVAVVVRLVADFLLREDRPFA
jgi:hypothetical protein